MQESRLFKLVYYLLNKGHATAPELAEKFEVSVRTIYRDIDVLSGAGVPIYTEPGRGGGIRLTDGYVLDKMVLSDAEQREILSALQGLSVTGGTSETEILPKLSALFHSHSENWCEVDFSRWGLHTQDNEKFEQLKYSVIHHKVIQIVYVSSYGEESERTIQPLKLLYKSKEWYLKAYCMEKQDFRLFKFSRITSLKPTDEEFVPKPYPDSNDWNPGRYPAVTLHFSKEIAYRVYDEFSPEQIVLQEDGTLTATARLPEDAWLIGYLLSFGTQVDVIEPARIRKILADLAIKIYEKNKC